MLRRLVHRLLSVTHGRLMDVRYRRRSQKGMKRFVIVVNRCGCIAGRCWAAAGHASAEEVFDGNVGRRSRLLVVRVLRRLHIRLSIGL